MREKKKKVEVQNIKVTNINQTFRYCHDYLICCHHSYLQSPDVRGISRAGVES